MFKKYLRIQPAPVQLLIFLTFWFVLMLLSMYLNYIFISKASGVKSDELQSFLEEGLYKRPNLVFISNAIFALFTFLVPAAIYAYLADPQPAKYLGSTVPRNKMQYLWITIMAMALIFFISPMGQWLKELDLGSASKALDERREKFIMSYISSGNAWTVVRSIFLIAVIPAICEEVFFRGIVMKFAYTLFKKWWVAVSASALMFALFHNSVSEFVPIFIAGIILGTVYYLTSSIWMNILLHLIFNGLQVVLSLWSDPELEKSLSQQGTLIGIFCVAAVIVSFCLFMLNKAKTPLPYNWSVVVPDEDPEVKS